jgi:hypothetical protein
VDRLEEMVEAAKNHDPSEYAAVVADIEAVMSRVEPGSWAADFMASIRDQAKRAGTRLSPRQQELFEGIKAENTLECVSRRGRWAQEYRAEHGPTAMVLAHYYLQTGYWTQMARSIIEDAEYVPPMEKFEKMRDNKFAKRVLDAWRADPKYAVGTSVTRRPRLSHGLLNKGGMVLSTTAPIISSAEGCKGYKVLPYDSPEPIFVEERDVKLFRRAKSS